MAVDKIDESQYVHVMCINCSKDLGKFLYSACIEVVTHEIGCTIMCIKCAIRLKERDNDFKQLI